MHIKKGNRASDSRKGYFLFLFSADYFRKEYSVDQELVKILCINNVIHVFTGKFLIIRKYF
jgi:hypothetical protein